MAKRILNIVSSAWRATLEEQDDTIVWLTHAMRGADARVAVLLQENAVGYAARGQDASGLAFGARRQTQPPQLADDLAKLIAREVPVYYVGEDAAERGIGAAELIDGVEPVERAKLPRLFDEFEHVLRW